MANSKELDNVDEKSKLNADGDTAEIKFQHSTNGEAKIEMPEAGNANFQCGLTKEELMKYANDPFWIVLRRVLLVLFWLLWIAMLVGAVAIIIITPGCAAPKEPEWYEKSPVYEIRVDKFHDGDGDQKPDLKGVNAKVPYLEGISISTVVLDKLFDPQQQRIIDPSVGSLDDFRNLTSKVKVLLKIPLNSVELSTEDQQRKFATMLDFWLKNGAAGFVFDELELIANKVDTKKLVKDWSGIIANFSTEEFPRSSVLSSYGTKLSEQDYCSNHTLILDFGLTELNANFTANDFVEKLKHTTEKSQSLCRSNLVLSNNDISPLVVRFSGAERDRIIMFSFLADATPFLIYGEEYARVDTARSSKLQRDNPLPLEMNWNSVEDFQKMKTNNYYDVFKRTAHIRQSPAILSGQTHLKVLNETVVAMSRIKKSTPGYVVVTNFVNQTKTIDLTELGSHMPDVGEMDVSSSRGTVVKGNLDFHKLTIGGEETKIFHFVANFIKEE